MGYPIFGQVLNRVEKFADFGRKQGKDFGKRAALPPPFFWECPPPPAAYPGFCSIRQLGLSIFAPPLWDFTP